MLRLKMVLMLMLLVAAVMTSAATFGAKGGFTAKAMCPDAGWVEAACETNESNPLFSSCSGSPSSSDDYKQICRENSCSLGSQSGTCCAGGTCYTGE